MVNRIFSPIQEWFTKKTDDQKGWICLIISVLVSCIIYFIIKNEFSSLYFISAMFIVRARLYWIRPYERKIRPIFKKILFVMFILWLILLTIELILRFTGTL